MTAPERTLRWRAHCRVCDWTIDGPVEQWARIAGQDHGRRAHGPRRKSYEDLYRWRGKANATQLRLLGLAATGTLRCTCTDVWTADGGNSVRWYAAGVSTAEHGWAWGLTEAGLLRVRETWSRNGIYIPTTAGHAVLAANGAP